LAFEARDQLLVHRDQLKTARRELSSKRNHTRTAHNVLPLQRAEHLLRRRRRARSDRHRLPLHDILDMLCVRAHAHHESGTRERAHTCSSRRTAADVAVSLGSSRARVLAVAGSSLRCRTSSAYASPPAVSIARASCIIARNISSAMRTLTRTSIDARAASSAARTRCTSARSALTAYFVISQQCTPHQPEVTTHICEFARLAQLSIDRARQRDRVVVASVTHRRSARVQMAQRSLNSLLMHGARQTAITTHDLKTYLSLPAHLTLDVVIAGRAQCIERRTRDDCLRSAC
jgi:hypothetical protein